MNYRENHYPAHRHCEDLRSKSVAIHAGFLFEKGGSPQPLRGFAMTEAGGLDSHTKTQLLLPKRP